EVERAGGAAERGRELLRTAEGLERAGDAGGVGVGDLLRLEAVLDERADLVHHVRRARGGERLAEALEVVVHELGRGHGRLVSAASVASRTRRQALARSSRTRRPSGESR